MEVVCDAKEAAIQMKSQLWENGVFLAVTIHFL